MRGRRGGCECISLCILFFLLQIAFTIYFSNSLLSGLKAASNWSLVQQGEQQGHHMWSIFFQTAYQAAECPRGREPGKTLGSPFRLKAGNKFSNPHWGWPSWLACYPAIPHPHPSFFLNTRGKIPNKCNFKISIAKNISSSMVANLLPFFQRWLCCKNAGWGVTIK